MSQEITLDAGTKITIETIPETPEITSAGGTELIPLTKDGVTNHISVNNLMEPVIQQAKGDIIGSALPTDSPSGTETVGQSYRVGNDTDEDETFANFLTNVSDGSGGFLPVKVPAKTSGLIIKNQDGWAFVPNAVDTSNLATKKEAVLDDDLNIIGTNLFNDATILDGKIVDNTGHVGNAAGWKTATQSIDATKEKLTIDGIVIPTSGSNKYYTINTDPVTVGYFTDMPTTISLPANATEISYSVKQDAETDDVLDNIVIQYGNEIEDYGIDEIKGKRIYNPGYTKEKANATFAKMESVQPLLDNITIQQKTTSNLVDPTKVALSNYINAGSGGLVPYPSYNTTGFIPVTPNTLYTIMNLDNPSIGYRQVCFFAADKTFLSGIDDSGYPRTFTIPETVNVGGEDIPPAFVRFSFPSAANTGYPTDPYNVGLFQGASPEWEQFASIDAKLNNSTPTADKENDSIATVGDVKSFVAGQDNTPGIGTIGYTLSTAGLLTISYPEGYITGNIGNSRGNTGNNMFNFGAYSLKNQVSLLPNDDVAPVHEQDTTDGANHGVVLGQFTATAHGLTNADRGYAWTTQDGATCYLALVVNANTLIFWGENTGTRESPSFANIDNGTITRVSDGHTLTLSAKTSVQLYPSIKNLQIKVLVNGLTELSSGSGTANYIDVVESYDIKLTDSMLENLINNPGNTDLTFPGDVSTSIRNIYRFLPNMATLVLGEYRKVYQTSFQDWMCNQSNCTIGQATQSYYYVPGLTAEINGSVDLRKPTIVLWSTSIPSTYIINSSQVDPDNPPSRLIMSNGKLAYLTGFLPGRGVSKALNNYTHATMEIRNDTGKLYPHAADSDRMGTPLPAGSIFNAIIMRVYTDLEKTRSGNRLWYFPFNFEGAEYVFIDYSGSMYDRLDLENSFLNGKEIEVIESINAELLTDTYNDGLTVKATYVEGETCTMVLKIK